MNPLYEHDSRTGASVEVFYADRGLAKSFGTHLRLILLELPALLAG
jgi:hypothetical protein